MATSISGNTGESLNETISSVQNVLVLAEPSGVTAEVIATALLYLKENPESSVVEALGVGLDDWDL